MCTQLSAQDQVFIIPFSGSTNEEIAVIETELTNFFNETGMHSADYFNIQLASSPSSWDDVKLLFQDIELSGLEKDLYENIEAGGWLAYFQLRDKVRKEKNQQFYSEILITCTMINLDTKSIHPPVFVKTAALSDISFDDADLSAILKIGPQLFEAFRISGFFDTGDLVYSITSRTSVYKNPEGILRPGDECLIQPGGYGIVLDTDREFIKVDVSKKPALPVAGGEIIPYITSPMEADIGASAFFELLNHDFGIMISSEIEFKRNSPILRFKVGADFLIYNRANNPLFLSGGVVYSRLLGKFRIDAAVSLGLGQSFAPTYALSHWGGKYELHFTFLLSSYVRLEIEAGILALMGINSPSVNGAIAGISIVFQ